jgi:hypothetical protein
VTMQSATVWDRINWGRNIAARAVGSPVDAYRPQDGSAPLAAGNRYLRLHALFTAAQGDGRHGGSHGAPVWQGCFDAAYTRAGDYLVEGNTVWFIASQRLMGSLLCLQTNRQVMFMRPSVPDVTTTSTYGGVTAATSRTISERWPASVLNGGAGGVPPAGLPTDNLASIWAVLLPSSFTLALLPSDIIQDDLGRNAVVMTSERTSLGWRILAKQATT